MKYIYNWYVFWFAFVFWYMETKYFGWNATPQSDAELICDGIVLLIASRGITRTPNTTVERETKRKITLTLPEKSGVLTIRSNCWFDWRKR